MIFALTPVLACKTIFPNCSDSGTVSMRLHAKIGHRVSLECVHGIALAKQVYLWGTV
jgi:hypothetical protein